jgi:hypothetical protein
MPRLALVSGPARSSGPAMAGFPGHPARRPARGVALDQSQDTGSGNAHGVPKVVVRNASVSRQAATRAAAVPAAVPP